MPNVKPRQQGRQPEKLGKLLAIIGKSFSKKYEEDD
jgi:hypothetical protein